MAGDEKRGNRMNYHRLEVRCCCMPLKLYGTLPVREDRLYQGAELRYTIAWAGPYLPTPIVGPVVVENARAEELLLVVEKFFDGEVPNAELEHERQQWPDTPRVEEGSYLALKYEGDSLPFEQKLHRISLLPGFEPAPADPGHLPDVEVDPL